MGSSLVLWFCMAALVSQNLLVPVMSRSFGDEKAYYPSPDPGSGSSPPSGHGGGSPPSGHGSSPHHGHHGHGGSPSHGGSGGSGNCGNPPSGGGGSYTPTPPSSGGSTPTPSTPDYTPTPPSGGGGSSDPSPPSTPTYNPSPSTPDYTPTPTTPSTPTPILTPPSPTSIDPGSPTFPGILPPPSPPTFPGILPPPSPLFPDPGSFPGTCTYWLSHPSMIYGLLGWWGTMGSVFPSISSFPGSSLTLPQALANTRSDGLGALYREGTASFLNAMSNPRFPYTTQQVRNQFVSALVSDRAASAQAQLFKKANEGRVKPRV